MKIERGDTGHQHQVCKTV